MSKMENISAYKKNWMKYRKHLMSGQWHVHTNYTDGENSVDEYCRKAVTLGIPLVVFSEHVRKELTYDYQDLVGEIKTARKKYPELIILTGCEAKVLEDGSLDVSEVVLKYCEIVLMAFHSFPNNKSEYIKALKIALSNPKVDVWAHPGLFLRNNNFSFTEKEIEMVFDLARQKNVLIEINRKYNLPPQSWVKVGEKKGVNFVKGGDIHRIDEFK